MQIITSSIYIRKNRKKKSKEIRKIEEIDFIFPCFYFKMNVTY